MIDGLIQLSELTFHLFSFEAGNEEAESDDSQEGEETPLQIPSLVVSSEDINADLDVEMIREQGRMAHCYTRIWLGWNIHIV